MSAVIHTLWERDDRSLLIMPASVPMSAPTVQAELTRYIETTWAPVIEKDVDGESSLPLRIDSDNPNLGRYSAARRVARTLFLGSAPTLQMANRGLDDRRIKLGCVQPGETVATFGDALRRLTDQATHLYVDGQRYWFATQPTVNRLAQDRAAQQAEDDVVAEIVQQLRQQHKDRGDFEAVHIAPSTTSDVPDERESRLVVLHPSATHIAKTSTSTARHLAEKFLAERGTSPRRNKNTLVFLAADNTRFKDLDQAVRQLLAWRSIEAERDTLNLDPSQAKQATHKRTQAEEAVKQRIPETYTWLLVPEQLDPQGEVTWEELRLQGQDSLAVRASRKLRNDELLVTDLSGTVLRRWLDKIPLWREDHISVRQLADYFAQYLYLPRLKNTNVLVEAIQNGAALLTWEAETFAYAEGYDAGSGRYRGLRTGTVSRVIPDGESVIVKPSAARRQLDIDAAKERERHDPLNYPSSNVSDATGTPGIAEGISGGQPSLFGHDPGPSGPGTAPAPAEPCLRRFYGAKQLDATRMSRDADVIAAEVVQHLASLMGARVRITIEIEADLPNGAPDQVVRTVTENCRTLRFETAGFEES
jgi:hypothetical protein